MHQPVRACGGDRCTRRQILHHIGERHVRDSSRLTQRPELSRTERPEVASESASQGSHAFADPTQPKLESPGSAVRAVTKRSFRQIAEGIANCELARSPQERLLSLQFLNLLHALSSSV